MQTSPSLAGATRHAGPGRAPLPLLAGVRRPSDPLKVRKLVAYYLVAPGTPWRRGAVAPCAMSRLSGVCEARAVLSRVEAGRGKPRAVQWWRAVPTRGRGPFAASIALPRGRARQKQRKPTTSRPGITPATMQITEIRGPKPTPRCRGPRIPSCK